MESESWRNVGKRIRKIRKENRLTLKQLAVGCGLSPNAISLVERGEVAPTVVTLCKIAHALGASASSFFHEVCPTEVVVSRAADEQDRVRSESLVSVLSSKDIPTPGDASTGSCCSITSQRTQKVLCVCGSIEYEVDDQCYVLNPGDALSFSEEAFHRWKNTGSETGVAVMVLASKHK